jgi:uncharacterized MAPEG superfamily protein
MTTELKWLVFTALLAGSLWMPFIVGVNVSNFEGKERLFDRPPDHSKMDPWIHRSVRAHQNLLEQLLPFAIVVIAGAVSGVTTSVTVACSIIFLASSGSRHWHDLRACPLPATPNDLFRGLGRHACVLVANPNISSPAIMSCAA